MLGGSRALWPEGPGTVRRVVVEPGVVRRCFAHGAEVRALLATRFERRSIFAGSLWRSESKSEHRPLRGAPRMRSFLAVTHSEYESIAPLPSNYLLREQTGGSQANASLMEHRSAVSPATPRSRRHVVPAFGGVWFLRAVRVAEAHHRGNRSFGSTTAASGGALASHLRSEPARDSSADGSCGSGNTKLRRKAAGALWTLSECDAN